MTELGRFCDYMVDRLDEFEEQWRKNHLKEPRSWPITMYDNEWLEQFLIFLENWEPTEEQQGLIPIPKGYNEQ